MAHGVLWALRRVEGVVAAGAGDKSLVGGPGWGWASVPGLETEGRKKRIPLEGGAGRCGCWLEGCILRGTWPGVGEGGEPVSAWMAQPIQHLARCLQVRPGAQCLRWKGQVDPSEVVTPGSFSHLPSHGSSRRQTRWNLSHFQLPI